MHKKRSIDKAARHDHIEQYRTDHPGERRNDRVNEQITVPQRPQVRVQESGRTVEAPQFAEIAKFHTNQIRSPNFCVTCPAPFIAIGGTTGLFAGT